MGLTYKTYDSHSLIKAYKKDISSELENQREINALFLTFGYIETYMKELILILGTPAKTDIAEKIIEKLKRMPMLNLGIINLLIGNIDWRLYSKIRQFNKTRNILAHELVKIDMESEETKNSIKAAVRRGMSICDEICKKYTQILVEKQAAI